MDHVVSGIDHWVGGQSFTVTQYVFYWLKVYLHCYLYSNTIDLPWFQTILTLNFCVCLPVSEANRNVPDENNNISNSNEENQRQSK